MATSAARAAKAAKAAPATARSPLHLRLFFDGGSRPLKAGPRHHGGCGAVVYIMRPDGEGDAQMAWKGCQYLKAPITSNEAEYMGLRLGLAAVRRYFQADLAALEVRGDSQLVINQMQGKYLVRSGRLRPLQRDLVETLEHLGCPTTLMHVPRRFNKVADQLATVATEVQSSWQQLWPDGAIPPAADPEPARAPAKKKKAPPDTPVEAVPAKAPTAPPVLGGLCRLEFAAAVAPAHFGVGVVLWSVPADGGPATEVLTAALAVPAGPLSAFAATYRALLFALAALPSCASVGVVPESLELVSSNALVVRQLKGERGVRQPQLLQLHTEALSQFQALQLPPEALAKGGTPRASALAMAALQRTGVASPKSRSPRTPS